MTSGTMHTIPSAVFEDDSRRHAKLFLDQHPRRKSSKQLYVSSEFGAPSLPEGLRLAAQEIVKIVGVDDVTIHWPLGEQPYLRLTLSDPLAICTAQEALWQYGLLEFESIAFEL